MSRLSPLQGQRHGSHGMTVWWDSSFQTPALSRAIWNPAQLSRPKRGSMSRLFAFAKAKARLAWNDGSPQNRHSKRPSYHGRFGAPLNCRAAKAGFHVSPFAFARAKARLAWNDGVVGLVIPNARPITGDLEPRSIVAAKAGFHVSPFRLCKGKGTARME